MRATRHQEPEGVDVLRHDGERTGLEPVGALGGEHGDTDAVEHLVDAAGGLVLDLGGLVVCHVRPGTHFRWAACVARSELEEGLLDDLGERGVDVEDIARDLVGGLAEHHRLQEWLQEQHRVGSDDMGTEDRPVVARRRSP